MYLQNIIFPQVSLSNVGENIVYASSLWETTQIDSKLNAIFKGNNY